MTSDRSTLSVVLLTSLSLSASAFLAVRFYIGPLLDDWNPILRIPLAIFIGLLLFIFFSGILVRPVGFLVSLLR